MRSALSISLVALTASVGCTPATVVRVIDGREIAGRFVSDRAYALYARGAEAEARGDLPDARLQYLSASEQDEDNAEVWTRVGAVSCQLGRDDDSEEAFSKAAARAPDYEPLYRERALCTLARVDLADVSVRAASGDRLRGAFEDAAKSLALDPDSEEAALLYARAAEAAGDLVKAERGLRELVVLLPGRIAGWRALRDFATRRGDTAAAARATAALETLGAARTATFEPRPAQSTTATPHSATNGAPPATTSATNDAPPTTTNAARDAGALADVDAALARGSLEDARTAAKRARLPPAELAVRAAALGRGQLAKTQAELVFKADPTSASAAIALAVASDLLHDDAGVATALASPAALTTPPSALARLLFAELLQRRTDRDAALAYVGPLTAPAPDTESLLRAVTERVRASLQK